MTISRGQMKRQLYEGGGIMTLSKEGIGGGDYKGIDMGSRTGFGILKKISRGVKKVAKGVKKIASSDVGKAALLYGATAGLGALGAGAARSGTGFGFLSPSNVLANLGAAGRNLGILKSIPDYGNVAQRSGPLAKLFDNPLGTIANTITGKGDGKGMGGLGKLATLGLVSKFLTDTLGVPADQAEEELARDPSGYLELYYRNLNPPTADTNSEQYEAQVREFVTANTSEYAVGGRVGFAEGPVLPPDPTQPVNPFGPKPGDFGIEEDIPIKMAGYGYNEAMSDTFDMYNDMKKKGLIPPTMTFDEFLQEVVPEMSKRKMEDTRGLAALGGRMNFDEGTPKTELGLQGLGSIMDEDMVVLIKFDENGKIKLVPMPRSEVMPNMSDVEVERLEKAKGDSASTNAMQAAGIEGLPIRKNQAGVKELDLRNTGGFIQPVGIKEKADDIPAMLSNNEFVFTADAVRGAGDGNVNVGAQRMYDMMKKLEAGGRV